MPLNETHIRIINDLFYNSTYEAQSKLPETYARWIAKAFSDNGTFDSFVQTLQATILTEDQKMPLLRLRQLYTGTPITDFRFSSINGNLLIDVAYGSFLNRTIPFNLESIGPITPVELKNCIIALYVQYQEYEKALSELKERRIKEKDEHERKITNLTCDSEKTLEEVKKKQGEEFHKQYGKPIGITKIMGIIPVMEDSLTDTKKEISASKIGNWFLTRLLKRVMHRSTPELQDITQSKNLLPNRTQVIEKEREDLIAEQASLAHTMNHRAEEITRLHNIETKIQQKITHLNKNKRFKKISSVSSEANSIQKLLDIELRKYSKNQSTQAELEAKLADVQERLLPLTLKRTHLKPRQDSIRRIILEKEDKILKCSKKLLKAI